MKYYLLNSYMQIQGDIKGAVTPCCPEKLYIDITEDCNRHKKKNDKILYHVMMNE